MNSLLTYVLPMVLLAFFVYRIYSERTLKESLRIVWILLVYGVFVMIQALQGTRLTLSVMGIYILGTIALGFAFGALRGFTSNIWYSESESSWLRKGTVWTVVVFFVGLLVNSGLKLLIEGKGSTNDVHALIGSSAMIHVAVSILGSRMVMLNRKNKAIK